ncbi:LapA family protein [Ferrovibrio sp.]|uniref:LapA family protein n=1 Tax=Ferrovibrio sp. TaxID=1917215 RepID=UPI0025BA5079|nr:LapA family protein [Ferrovibrio sp.]MBX3456089.1 LapA family protein [Ferrovibrio sp.]
MAPLLRFLRLLIAALVLLLLAVFAVANRQTVSVSLDPLPFAMDLPLYLLVFGIFLVGLVLGALGQWLGGKRQPKKPAPSSTALDGSGPKA